MATCSARHAGCWPEHALMVETYRSARLQDELRRDVEAGGTVEEWAAFNATIVTLKRWLTSGGAALQRRYEREGEV